MNRIGLVTPLKNEIDSIDRLFQSIEKQTIEIFMWLIVENDSNDGSAEKLKEITNVSNVAKFEVININFEDKTYQLGTKYAQIIETGFNYLKSTSFYKNLDFIGILDSDCFPEPNYYQSLVDFMNHDDGLGISAGIIYDSDGNRDIANINWVRGGCRIWKIKCFKEAGYVVGPSADTLSVCKAILAGWQVYPHKGIKVISRKLGDKVNFKYYGYSVYFRGHTPLYAILKSLILSFRFQFLKAKQFLYGYFNSYFKKMPKVNDKQVLDYYRNYMLRKIFKID